MVNGPVLIITLTAIAVAVVCQEMSRFIFKNLSAETMIKKLIIYYIVMLFSMRLLILCGAF